MSKKCVPSHADKIRNKLGYPLKKLNIVSLDHEKNS